MYPGAGQSLGKDLGGPIMKQRDQCDARLERLAEMEQKACESDRGLLRRSSIRRRIDEALMACEHVNRRAEAALRARQIIDQHPEFAELLDLINEF